MTYTNYIKNVHLFNVIGINLYFEHRLSHDTGGD